MDNQDIRECDEVLVDEIVMVVRSAIEDGLITSTSLDRFDHQVGYLEGPELEEYLQDLWDRL
jgi:hypothetical protein